MNIHIKHKVEQTELFRYLQKKKSNGMASGERGDHEIDPSLPIQHSENVSQRKLHESPMAGGPNLVENPFGYISSN
ncbi:hypothetical protein TNCV_1649671 [Trichonephila clavipes]|nr:hypothetical protein TNCV_1649671 [Trichonephila clavipes]